ncbi:EthD family reductase [Paraburkholderia fungorum]|uniref:Ethyl tert-butyl ether degradation protein EthD n=1 Tax=Paraburkholderia fungorum TaxID=134537 RepID=A0A420GU10_9BURK|nr:ethyl tert-butyl ether degradation protein EthD [Paraburkholderia fungorum]
MEVCFFLLANCDGTGKTQPPIDTSWLEAASREIQGLTRFVIHLPAESPDADPQLKTHTSGPRCALQWYFDDLGLLETALQTTGAIHGIVDRLTNATELDLTFAQQAMAVRPFATPNPGDANPRAERCTYLVSYEGEAEDFNTWLTHYLTHHPPLMAQLPGIRELEIYTRLDFRSGLAIARATAMQRNKVVFDNAEALAAALASPVRTHMRQDFNAFPPYSGPTPHFPMRSIYGNLKPT